MTQPEFTGPLEHTKPPTYFGGAIDDAERLMKYAAEIGVDVSPDTRSAILHARTAYTAGWNEDIAAHLLDALTGLAARLKPVNAESLKAYHDDTRPTVRNYLKWAIVLACVIIPASVCTFVTSAVSTAIVSDVSHANALAVKLRSELGPPLAAGSPPAEIPKGISDADVISDLQDYAATVRLINARAKRLNWFVARIEKTPVEDIGTREARKEKFELQVGIPDPITERDRITETYQDVRYFAQAILADISVFYGAITACILPVLYALLGTCAYLLRTFEDQMSTRTFTPSAANSARFVIAAIGGAVVGLFNNFAVTQEASLSPLALSFLVGYAVDVFFAFLEGLIKAFTKNVPSAHAAPELTTSKS
jgi:hypothetical protein